MTNRKWIGGGFAINPKGKRTVVCLSNVTPVELRTSVLKSQGHSEMKLFVGKIEYDSKVDAIKFVLDEHGEKFSESERKILTSFVDTGGSRVGKSKLAGGASRVAIANNAIAKVAGMLTPEEIAALTRKPRGSKATAETVTVDTTVTPTVTTSKPKPSSAAEAIAARTRGRGKKKEVESIATDPVAEAGTAPTTTAAPETGDLPAELEGLAA